MSSNSIRVGAELFSLAQQHGALMSRSAAQQIEHWARIGAALEATGLSVTDVARLLRGGADTGDNSSNSHDPTAKDEQVIESAKTLREVLTRRMKGSKRAKV